ncbi:hypothetical protein ACFQ1E_17260 [Sphingomonas canadensis]|uniref:Exo-alpha-sialidase n=1 Tax=Sphingomonas canadensis TaxID=1219257 RepID=A0ABW3H9E1_9SPHN|nr:hypothetical protein [Sphingomonas canadensis]MCW3837796.1 hypothetical protein [Sphingomonas canadensis]
MIKTATVRLRAVRTTPFTLTVRIVGLDLTGATIAGEVRQRYDAPGDPELEFNFTTPDVATEDGAPVSTFVMSIPENEIELVEDASEPGGDVNWIWALDITPSGGTKQRYLEGEFIVGGPAGGAGSIGSANVTVADQTLTVEIDGAAVTASFAAAAELSAQDAAGSATSAAAERVLAQQAAADLAAQASAVTNNSAVLAGYSTTSTNTTGDDPTQSGTGTGISLPRSNIVPLGLTGKLLRVEVRAIAAGTVEIQLQSVSGTAWTYQGSYSFSASANTTYVLDLIPSQFGVTEFNSAWIVALYSSDGATLNGGVSGRRVSSGDGHGSSQATTTTTAPYCRATVTATTNTPVKTLVDGLRTDLTTEQAATAPVVRDRTIPAAIPYLGAAAAEVQADGVIRAIDYGVVKLAADAPAKFVPWSTSFLNAGAPTKITTSAEAVYNAWPEGSFYDAGRDQLVLIYMSAPAHSPSPDLAANYTRKVKCRVLANASAYDVSASGNPFGSAVTVCEQSEQDCYSYTGVCLPNGNYLVLCLRTKYPGEISTNLPILAATSTDGGATWSTATLTDYNGTAIVDDASGGSYPYGLVVDDDGAVYFWHLRNATYGSVGEYTWYRSADGTNGSWRPNFVMDQPWRSILLERDASIPLAGTSTQWNPFEPVTVKLADGLMMTFWRPTASGGTTGAYSLYTIGRRVLPGVWDWTPWQACNVGNAANNPAVVYHRDLGMLEMMVAPRGNGNNTGGSYGGVYLAQATLEDALRGRWNIRHKVCSALVGSNSTYWSDFGAPQMLRAGSNVFGLYYDQDGSNNSAQIYLLKGVIGWDRHPVTGRPTRRALPDGTTEIIT